LILDCARQAHAKSAEACSTATVTSIFNTHLRNGGRYVRLLSWRIAEPLSHRR
jgi:hypothetical protein